MSSELERILVVGPIGAGKSFAAREIGEMAGLPVVHIDRIMLDPDTRLPKPRDRFIEDAEAFFAQPRMQSGWVADGTYRSLRHLTWERADAIGYIRPGLIQNISRIVQRCVTHDTSGGQNPDTLYRQLNRLRGTRQEDIAKLDTTTQEFRELGTMVIEEPTSRALITAFAGILAVENSSNALDSTEL